MAASIWMLWVLMLLLSVVPISFVVIWWNMGVWLFVVGVVSVSCVVVWGWVGEGFG